MTPPMMKTPQPIMSALLRPNLSSMGAPWRSQCHTPHRKPKNKPHCAIGKSGDKHIIGFRYSPPRSPPCNPLDTYKKSTEESTTLEDGNNVALKSREVGNRSAVGVDQTELGLESRERQHTTAKASVTAHQLAAHSHLPIASSCCPCSPKLHSLSKRRKYP